jgi:hypothetical protein
MNVQRTFSLLYVNIGTRERHEYAEDILFAVCEIRTRERHEYAEDILFAVCEHWDEREA